ncbi:MAG: glycosyltransferase, partial [Flavobacteriales bacterium]
MSTRPTPKNIWVAPLDWGLGHATRCVPLINRLLAEGHHVYLASNGRSARWLANYFPKLEVHTDIPDYAVTYPISGSMQFHFLKESPRLLRVIRAEHDWLAQFAERHAIDEVYSDNRYGLYHERIPCFIITHQLFIRAPWYARRLLYWMTHHYIQRFDQCLVPDYEGAVNLSGELSHGRGVPQNVRYIGPQSRFSEVFAEENVPCYDVVALISGPEPTRSEFQRQLLHRLLGSQRSALMVCGTPDESFDRQEGNVRLVSHLPDAQLAGVLKSAGHIICRPGYSTIMDLHVLGCKAEFIPTPGQTEQEYLWRVMGSGD